MAQIKIDLEKCTGCGTCTQICPANVYELKDGKSHVKDGKEKDCLECHACEIQCTAKAITVE